jgi:uncharacterized protein
MKLPSRDEALSLMAEAGCNRHVINHCVRVTKLALYIAGRLRDNGYEVDCALVEAGALLHDLGRSKTHGVDHGVVGGGLALGLGLPTSLVKIIERHVGAGITADEAVKLGLPEKSYMPVSLEEKIVAYADDLIEGDKVVDIEVTVEKFSKELGDDHPSLRRLRALHDEIVSLIGNDLKPDIDLRSQG